ncbi:MAG: signal peptidase I, partial [Polaromonas sp.]|nr:signal peptidase I [Polaromonas sp.]
MQVLTSIILAAFAAYAGTWYFGFHEGNFPLLLLIAVVVTGCYWLAERFYFLPQREKAAEELEKASNVRMAELTKLGIDRVDGDIANIASAKEKLRAQPWWLDWTAGLFPVILIVFLLRSFLFEPFKIPTGSMIPTLLVGDLILVNKYHYGLRLPVINKKITDGTAPARGDVMVFKYPPNPQVDYIKRVVGTPGDEISYSNKKLTINGKPIATSSMPEFFNEDEMHYSKQFEEMLGTKKHRILNEDSRPAFISGSDGFDYVFR